MYITNKFNIKSYIIVIISVGYYTITQLLVHANSKKAEQI